MAMVTTGRTAKSLVLVLFRIPDAASECLVLCQGGTVRHLRLEHHKAGSMIRIDCRSCTYSEVIASGAKEGVLNDVYK